MTMKIILSIGSFIPLYITIIVIDLSKLINNNIDKYTHILTISSITVIVIISVVSLIFTNLYINNILNKNISDEEFKFKKIKLNKRAYLDYMMTYFLPLFSLNMDLNFVNILVTNFLIIIFIFINAKAENFQINIILILRKYDVFIGKNMKDEEKCILMKKNDYSNLTKKQEQYRFVEFCDDIYILKREEKEEV